MSCEALSDKLSGYLDRELDERATGEVEAHLRQCVTCSARLERERRLRAAVQSYLPQLRAPERLRNKVRTMLQSQVKQAQRRQSWLPTWAATAAALVFGLVGGWQLATWRGARGADWDLTGEVFASHVRSLQGAHLTDIASSEHHTVKPWFTGKLDFSPPVPDFTVQGFSLTGGRLDYLGERQVAALVYRRRQHVINLFVWPSRDSSPGPRTASLRGYHAVYGSAGGMAYWAVSDLNQTELTQFGQLLVADLTSTPVKPNPT